MGLVRGDTIKLRAFGGKRIVRRFVEKRRGAVLICSHEEYELALREKREPLCIGFRTEDVIGYKAQDPMHKKEVRVIRNARAS